MATLVIQDLEVNRELDRQALAQVSGGFFVPTVGNIGPSLGSILGPELRSTIYPGGVWNTALFGPPQAYYPTTQWYTPPGDIGLYKR